MSVVWRSLPVSILVIVSLLLVVASLVLASSGTKAILVVGDNNDLSIDPLDWRNVKTGAED